MLTPRSCAVALGRDATIPAAADSPERVRDRGATLPAVAASATRVRVKAPGTCGELAQGYWNGHAYLINCPITWHAEVEAEVIATPRADARFADFVTVEEAGHFAKLARAARLAAEMWGRRGARLQVAARLPRGKGLASSTAELAAGVHALAAVWGEPLDAEAVTRLLMDVDRSTDAVHLPGITRVNHVTGRTWETWPAPRGMGVVVVDDGGRGVDTMGFDRARAQALAEEQASLIAASLGALRHGLAIGDLRLIAHGATLSARANQAVLPKAMLEELVHGTEAWGGLGVNAAHTGTVLGVLFDAARTDGAALAERVATLVGKERVLGVHRVMSGGITPA